MAPLLTCLPEKHESKSRHARPPIPRALSDNNACWRRNPNIMNDGAHFLQIPHLNDVISAILSFDRLLYFKLFTPKRF